MKYFAMFRELAHLLPEEVNSGLHLFLPGCVES